MVWIRASRLGSANSLFVLLLGGVLIAGCGESHPGDSNAGSGGDAGKGPSEAGKRAQQPAPQGGFGGAGRSGEAVAGSAGLASVAGRVSSAGRGGSHTPVETTFVFRNDGQDALMLGSNCGLTWPSLHEQENELGFVNMCSCACEDRSVCGCPAVCLNTQQLVVPGTSVSKTWDGVALDYSTDMTRSCYVKHVPAPGTKLQVDACWNYGDRAMPEGCSEEWFAYGHDTEVTISAKPTAAGPIKTKVGLNNTTGAPIYVVKERCGSQDWFRLDMGKQISVNTFCACPCDEKFERASCPTCGGCTEDVIEAVAPGATISFDWDSGFWHQYESGCSNRYTLPRGSQAKVQLCWSKAPQAAPTCQTSYVNVGATMVLAAF